MSTGDKRTEIRLDKLNPLGRAVWLAGAALHVGGRFVQRATRIATQSRSAFRDGLKDKGPTRPLH